MHHLRWSKSSYSGSMNNCIEVAALDIGRAVRDSKHPTGSVLMFTTTQWAAFTTGIRAGQFE